MTNTITGKMKANPKGKVEHKAAPHKSSATGYRDHIEGSRKGKVHELYDKQGAEAAWTLALQLRLVFEMSALSGGLVSPTPE